MTKGTRIFLPALAIATATCALWCGSSNDIGPDRTSAGSAGSQGTSNLNAGNAGATAAGAAGGAGTSGATDGGGTDGDAQAGNGGTSSSGAGGTPQAGTGGTGSGGGTSGAGGAAACPSGKGPTMVRVPGPGGTSYCIDTTEVTQTQYVAFANSKGNDTSGQRAECSSNTSYVPVPTSVDPGGETHGECPTSTFDVNHPSPTLPMTCVDWCDANAFCGWAGKRLCGAIGGGATAPMDAKGQWYNACSQQGSTNYPYGNTYQPKTCVDYAFDHAVMNPKMPVTDADVASSAPGCHGVKAPFDQLHDMSGNVSEWEDDCAGIFCQTRGGDYTNDDSASDTPHLNCSPGGGALPTTIGINVGFRCCAD